MQRILPQLRVFLCHSSSDKPVVRDIYRRLQANGVRPWFDEKDLLAGQDWKLEIKKAIQNSDAIIVCLSENSINKRGYIQKEIKYALDVADEQPEGAIFIIPLRLEKCEVPQRLNDKQWIDYFESDGYERLISVLEVVSKRLGIKLNPLPHTFEEKLESLFEDQLKDEEKERAEFIDTFKAIYNREINKKDQFIFNYYKTNGEYYLLLLDRHISNMKILKKQISSYKKQTRTQPAKDKRGNLLVDSHFILAHLIKSGFVKEDNSSIVIDEHMKNTMTKFIAFLRARNKFEGMDEARARMNYNIIVGR